MRLSIYGVLIVGYSYESGILYIEQHGQQSVYVSFVTYPDLFARLFFSLVGGSVLYTKSFFWVYKRGFSKKSIIFVPR